MRASLLPSTLLLVVASATTTALDLQPFLAALPITLQDYILPNSTSTTPPTPPTPAHDLLKRQLQTTTIPNAACPTSYTACANLGAPNLCCASNAVCSADYAGHVACCRSGAACSGTISQVITGGTVSDGVLVGAGGAGVGSTTDANGGLVTATTGAATTTTGGAGLVVATTTADSGTTGSGFVLDGTSTVATPGLGLRGAEVPLIARAILQALQYMPI